MTIASITVGIGSTDGNGYRQNLLNKLTGNSVEMIGSKHSGTMKLNSVEGYPGYWIEDVRTAVKQSGALKQHPNVILVHVGTNDILGGKIQANLDDAPQRFIRLIDDLVKAVPEAVIVVAQLIPTKVAGMQPRIDKFNRGVVQLVTERAQRGIHILTVNMKDFITINNYSPDGIHPCDQGYKQMADGWMSGLAAANSRGWLKSKNNQQIISRASKAHTTSTTTNVYRTSTVLRAHTTTTTLKVHATATASKAHTT